MSDEIKHQALADFGALTSNAQEVLGYLFVRGPLEDGDISSKNGRGELHAHGMVERGEGWTWLTQRGVYCAIHARVKDWSDQRWHKKQSGQVS